MDRIRVEVDGNGQKVLFIPEDGSESVDISNSVTGVDVTIRVQEHPRVTCHALLSMPTVFEGELENIILNVIPPEMIPQVIKQLMEKASPLPFQEEENLTGLESDVQEVYEHWRTERGRDRKNYDKISPNRRKKIVARLGDGFTVAELKQAISNVANDPWEDRPKHDDIPVLLRNREQVERFLEMEGVVSIPPRRYGYGVTTEEMLAEADRIEAMKVAGAIESGEKMDAAEEIIYTGYELSAGS